MSKLTVCPHCDAAGTNEDICLSCGKEIKKSESDSSSLPGAEGHQKVQSIFTDLIDKRVDQENGEVLDSLGVYWKVMPAVLSGFLLFLGVLSYYLFVYSTPDFISPLVLSAQDIEAGDFDNPSEIPLTSLNSNEKIIDLKLDFTEGNFSAIDVMQFAPPDVQMVLQVFDINKIFEKYFDAEILTAAQKYFDFSNDDLEVYLTPGFALMYPDGDFSTWGYVTGVNPNGRDFVLERAEITQTDRKELEGKYEFKDYYVDVVENGDLYLLVSNSKEFLDQMKESAEGNLLNLKSDTKYAKAKLDMPVSGQVFVYKNNGTDLWAKFTEWVSGQFDYTGLDKILNEISTPGVTFYSLAGKLKIVSTQE